MLRVAVHDAGVGLNDGVPEGLEPGDFSRVEPPLGAPRCGFSSDDLDSGEVAGEPVEEHLANVDRVLIRAGRVVVVVLSQGLQPPL